MFKSVQLYSMSDKQYFLSVGAMFKNEAHILREWLEHYIYRGVEHFYLINDNSTDNFLEIIQPFQNKITLIDMNENQFLGRQVRAYNKIFDSKKQETEWLLIIDLDEFVYSPSTTNFPEMIRNIVSNNSEIHQISFNMVLFGSSGFVEQPKCVTTSFTKRGEYGVKRYAPQPPPYGWMLCNTNGQKSFVKTSEIQKYGIHGHFVSGKTVNFSWMNSNETAFKLYMNHYVLQSKNWFLKVKGTRGDADAYLKPEERNLKYFEAWDVNDVKDTCLAEQNKNLPMNHEASKIIVEWSLFLSSMSNHPKNIDY